MSPPKGVLALFCWQHGSDQPIPYPVVYDIIAMVDFQPIEQYSMIVQGIDLRHGYIKASAQR